MSEQIITEAPGSSTKEYVKLEQRLVLLAWLNAVLGYADNSELLEDMKNVSESYDSSGRSGIYHRIESRLDKLQIHLSDLARYEDNIRDHLRNINIARPEPITLRYFQHLAILYTEIFLDRYFNNRKSLLHSLNILVDERNQSKAAVEAPDMSFCEDDLHKLAFWMATGSGKTLIMHINYLQFLRYNDTPLDNILLITPNEGMTDQHIAEMLASGIPSRRFDLKESSLLIPERDVVRVIEIYKLVEQKRGGGVSVPVEAFEGNNLIFVDEGHKGAGGTAWMGFRDALGETGFTFEYSATFGQALTAARDDELTAEYGKNIIFDYSYRYFYEDGFGKDFQVLNLKEETTEERTDLLLLGNLLSFYEQQRVYSDQSDEIRPYILEKPLWVFVGSRVNVVYTENKKKRSDVLTVCRFLHRVLQNNGNWVVDAIEKLLSGNHGLNASDDRDVFEGKYEFLKASGMTSSQIYQDILMSIFHSAAGGSLHLHDIRETDGELGLKVSAADDYFGLIYIGDTNAFKRLVDADDAGFILEDDVISSSLFEGIGDPDTNINVLIGAKKFMEGWNSWRVSNMGLLNVGRGEGSEIIQLFGRGVRLKGKSFSLKRSSALDGSHPRWISILETLNIFAVRANYMTQFREYLGKEGVESYLEFPVSIKPDSGFLAKGLAIPRVPNDLIFEDNHAMLLEPDPSISVRVDMTVSVDIVVSGSNGIIDYEAQEGIETFFSEDSLELVDWEQAYLDLIEYKQQKEYSNLVIQSGIPQEIIRFSNPRRLYKIIAPEDVIRPRKFADRELLQEAVTRVLKKYVDSFYRVQRERWDTKLMVYRELDESDPNLTFGQAEINEAAMGQYVVGVKRSETQLISDIETLIHDVEKIYSEESSKLPRLHFDRHIYQPLLLDKNDSLRIRPPGLQASEIKFVKDLRDFWDAEKDKSLKNLEVFLLRNLSRGAGVGFFENRGFYPDFIMWIVNNDKQHIVFIEPHGMVFAGPYQDDHRAKLHEALKELAPKIEARSENKDIILDSFIISSTPYTNLREIYDDGSWDRMKFTKAHILFLERSEEYDYLKHLFEHVMAVQELSTTSLTKEQLRIIPEMDPIVWEQAYQTLLPVYSLKAAAGQFGSGKAVDPEGWVEVADLGTLDKFMFVAQVVGNSMEPRINDGDYCVFRADVVGSRDGKVVLAQHHSIEDPETGGSYTVKKYHSEKIPSRDAEWKHSKITLIPENPDYEPIELVPQSEDDINVIAELKKVLGPISDK